MKVILKRTKPFAILCYEALFRELIPPLRENKTLLDEFASHRAGFRGERNADYIVATYPHKKANVFQGLRLKNGPFNFQMDTLIVTPTFILIMEIKNLKGELEYNPKTQQLIQHDGETKKSQKNPILQADMQKRHLTSWLQQSGFPPIPIETIAVSTNSTSILYYTDENVLPKKFIQLDSLPTTFDKLFQTYSKQIYDSTTIKKLNKRLLKENTPHKPDLIGQFGIKDRHLIKGIACLNCHSIPMQYKNRKWKCTKCGQVDTKAHERKILDHFLLYSPTITNRECRELLQISSPKVARRILCSMNLGQSGENFGRKYLSPTIENYPQDSIVPIEKRSIFND